jgi:hypothetical protein
MRPICLLGFLCLVGCNGDNSPPLNGIVVTNTDIDESYVIGNCDDRSPDDTPVLFATARLFLDNDHTKPVGDAVVSDKNGRYVLPAKGLPRPIDNDGRFFLLIEADGYISASHPITPGPLSRYVQHAVYLRKKQ